MTPDSDSSDVRFGDIDEGDLISVRATLPEDAANRPPHLPNGPIISEIEGRISEAIAGWRSGPHRPDGEDTVFLNAIRALWPENDPKNVSVSETSGRWAIHFTEQETELSYISGDGADHYWGRVTAIELEYDRDGEGG